MNGIEEAYAGRLTVVRLNVDEPKNARVQADYGLRGHPAVAILDADGRVAHRFFGAETAATLQAALDGVLPDS